MSIALPPARRERLVETRRDLHRHPELGFEEVRTARLVAERLRALGLAPREGVAKTGVTALVEGRAGPGRTLLIRADMDALPIEERNEVPYRSLHRGRMHACGHDGHVAILLAVAEALVEERDRLCGRVLLCFQPAEESPGGALPMIEAGVLADPPVDAAIGLHLSTMLPTGQVSVREGPVMAAVDRFEMRIAGRGGHGAKPQETADPIVAAAHVVSALQTLVSRERDPLDPAVLTIGAIHGGTAMNVIPGEVAMLGSVRTYSKALREAMPGRIERVGEGVAEALGCRCHLDYSRLYPTTVNDPAMAGLVRAAAAEAVGEANVTDRVQGMWSEDFAFFGERVPACFFFVGARNEARGFASPHHSDTFDFDEQALPIGVEVFLHAARRYLGGAA